MARKIGPTDKIGFFAGMRKGDLTKQTTWVVKRVGEKPVNVRNSRPGNKRR